MCVFLLAGGVNRKNVYRQLDGYCCRHVPKAFEELSSREELAAMCALTGEEDPFAQISRDLKGMDMRRRFQADLDGPYVIHAPDFVSRDTMQKLLDYWVEIQALDDTLEESKWQA